MNKQQRGILLNLSEKIGFARGVLEGFLSPSGVTQELVGRAMCGLESAICDIEILFDEEIKK